MLKRLALVMVLFSAQQVHAGFMAIANGVVTGGCDDCGSTGNGLFGLGASADLAGRAFTLEFQISDSFFTQPIHVGTPQGTYWSTENENDISAFLTLNGTRFAFPEQFFYDTSIGWNTDGNFFATIFNEFASAPDASGMIDWSKEFVGARGDHSMAFSSRHLRLFPEQLISATRFSGTLGDFALTPYVERRSVPEPAPVALLAMGLAGILLVRRRGGFIRLK